MYRRLNMCPKLNTGDAVVTKQKPSIMEYPWHYLAFGEGSFYWMSAITFKILARATDQNLVSIYRPEVGYACLFDQSRFGAIVGFVPLSMVALSARETICASK